MEFPELGQHCTLQTCKQLGMYVFMLLYLALPKRWKKHYFGNFNVVCSKETGCSTLHFHVHF